MERFKVVGGRPLVGGVEVVGAKNSALKLMAAALLAEGRTTLANVPVISDVGCMAQLLERLGCAVKLGDEVLVDVPARIGYEAEYDLVRRLRASICVLGPLLARCGRARVALPGGDNIGSRGLDMHLAGLERLGAQVAVEHGYVVAKATGGLRGAPVWLDFPSVGATENVAMAAVLARGTTVVDNAAREPEVQDLLRLLVAMGARIEGIGTSTLTIHGVDGLRPAQHRTVADRVVAGTWAFGAVLSAGRVELHGGRADHLEVVLDRLVTAGADVSVDPRGFTVAMSARPRSFDVVTLPYPGFPSDLQPFAMTLAAVSEGTAMITENVFESRFMFAQELARLGAELRTDGHHAVVRGRPRLSGAPVLAPDIRAGAALVLAGLVAEGTTTVSAAHHVDRGYPDFVGTLRRLGADITREPDDFAV